jgi:ankyrin repeat protein
LIQHHHRNLNIQDKKGRTPLMLAMRKFLEHNASDAGADTNSKADKYQIVIIALIKADVDLNKVDKRGKTAQQYLQQALRKRDQRMRHLDARDEIGHTRLSNAIMQKNTQEVLRLLAQGANPSLHYCAHTIASKTTNTKTDRVTALMFAAQFDDAGDIPILKALVASGADMNAQDSAGLTAVDYALRARNHAGLDFLLKLNAQDCNAKRQDEDGYTLLNRAIETGLDNAALFLIQHNNGINAANYNGQTPLMKAIARNHISDNSRRAIINALVHAGAAINKKDIRGCTAAMCAIKQQDYETLKTLLQTQKVRDIADCEGNSLFHFACKEIMRSGKQEVVDIISLLLKYKYDFLSPNNNGETPIMLLANDPAYGAKALKLLLQHDDAIVPHKIMAAARHCIMWR